MKLLKKSMAALAVIFAASLFMAACSNNDDGDSKPSSLTPPAVYLPEEYASKELIGRYVYRVSNDSYADTEALYLFSDKEYLVTANVINGKTTTSVAYEKGTYTLTGSATDGKVVFTKTHYYDGNKWTDATKVLEYDIETHVVKEITVVVEPVECTIANGVLKWYDTSFNKE